MDDEDTKQIEARVDALKEVPSGEKDLLKLKLRADAQSKSIQRAHEEVASARRLVGGVTMSVLGGSGAVVLAIASAIWFMASFVAEVRAEMTSLHHDIDHIQHQLDEGGRP